MSTDRNEEVFFRAFQRKGSSSMIRLRGHFGHCLALAVLLGLAVGQARAGSLTLVVTAWDGASVTITGGPFGTVTNGGNSLSVSNITGLNSFLASNGSAAQFNSLSASSDFAPSAGVATGSFVTQAGSVFYDTAITGTGAVTVQAFQMGFQLPSGPVGVMQSSATANYTQATAGSTETFTSTYNSGPTAAALISTSTGPNQNNYSPNNLTNIPLFVTPFELSNTTTFSLLPNVNAQSTDGFTGSTTVTTSSVPEPASAMLLFTGCLPVAVVVYRSRRRRAAGK
jgi:hypothetical protein